MKFLFLLLLLPTIALADWHLIEVQEVNVEYKQFLDGSRDAIVSQDGLGNLIDKEVNLNINFDISEYFYWNNMIHSIVDSNGVSGGQFRLIGWNFRVGLRLTNYFDIEWEHFSQHLLDVISPFPNPTQNSINIRIYLYRKNPNENILITLP